MVSHTSKLEGSWLTYQDEKYEGKKIEDRGEYGKDSPGSCVEAQVLLVPVGVVLPYAGVGIERPG